DWNSPNTYAPNGRPNSGGGTTWRWHGYGAATPAPVAQRRTTNATANYAPAYIPAESPSQPMTPLPMPTPQQTHMTPLPMPSTMSHGELGPPTAMPDAAAQPPMTQPLPPGAVPSNGSVAIEPTWRAAGTQVAATTEMSSDPEPWVAAGTRNNEVMRALYAS